MKPPPVKKKAAPVVEDSVFLRMLWFFLSLTCLTLISEVDPDFSSLTIGEFKLPLMIVYLWMCISGCFLTFHYRHKPPKWLTAVGLLGIIAVIWWFVQDVRHQWITNGSVDILLPVLHLVAGLFVSHSFELRTRNDFNFSVGLSLLVMFMTATMGRGLFFGFGMVVYLSFAGIMLLLDCESRTFGNVCERGIEGLDLNTRSIGKKSEKTANLVFPVAAMMALSLVIFVALPRAEAIADGFTSQFYKFFKPRRQTSDDLLERLSIQNPLKHPAPPADASGKPGKDKNTGKNSGSSPGQGSQGKEPKDRTGSENGTGSKDSSTGGKTGKTGNDSAGKSGTPEKDSAKDSSKVTQKDSRSKDNKDAPQENSGTPGSNTRPPDETNSRESLDMETPVPRSEKLAFTVQCNRTVYYKQAAFDTFDGMSWTSSRPDIKVVIPRFESAFQVPSLPSETLPMEVSSIVLKQQYKCQADIGHKMPFAGYPEEIRFVGDELTMDSCGTIRSHRYLVTGTEYTIYSQLPLFDVKSLRKAESPSAADEKNVRDGLHNFLTVPDSQDQEVSKMAQETAGNQGNWYNRAEKISKFLRKNYKSTQASCQKSENSVNQFLLETKTGNCKEFASAFTLMCRSAGIPARVVVGYHSGDFDPKTGLRQVKMKHGHAWAEAYIPQAGWIPFDATPEGTMPERSGEKERYVDTLTRDLGESLAQTKKDGEASTSGAKEKPGDSKTPGKNSKAKTPGKGLSLEKILHGIITSVPGVLGVLILGITLMGLISTLRIVSDEHKRHPASKIYKKFLMELKKAGLEIKPADAPFDVRRKLEIAGLPSQNLADLLDAADKFLTTYNRVLFGQREEIGQLDSDFQAFMFRLKSTLK